ncbi:MAG TPA: FAD-dependent oxidoreductase [Longilinea sp.]|nr:FAD-dependent oxidoreductase [Longilinea sp.]
MSDKNPIVAVVGAGPAGLFAARELSSHGINVVLFNRDIRPGGLAEYGIYPRKHRLKDGLRKQFHQILGQETIAYFGNVSIGVNRDLTLEDIRGLGFQAILVTAGAQGNKALGLPGEDLEGIYHAKDVVYYYNGLPPYSERPMNFGNRAAIIGMGNVMMDIARFLIEVKHANQVDAYARRGPAEIKFDRRELLNVIGKVNIPAFEAEIKRCRALMEALGQNAEEPLDLLHSTAQEAGVDQTEGPLSIHFLLSPKQFIGDEKGHVKAVEWEENTLVAAGDTTKAVGSGRTITTPVDTVIYAIGDQVDDQLGLPLQKGAFIRNLSPLYPIDGESYEAAASDGSPLEGIFLAGWSRNASTGQVGIANRDGTNGSRAVLEYLNGKSTPEKDVLDATRQRLSTLGKPVVTWKEIKRLLEVESLRGCAYGDEEFKLISNQEMLTVMGLLE